MRLLSVNDRNDSLLLRTQSKPLDDGMLHTEEFERLVAGMLATVRDPANEGVGIAAPQVGIPAPSHRRTAFRQTGRTFRTVRQS